MTTHCHLACLLLFFKNWNMISFWSYRRNDGLLWFSIQASSMAFSLLFSCSSCSFFFWSPSTSIQSSHSCVYSHCRSLPPQSLHSPQARSAPSLLTSTSESAQNSSGFLKVDALQWPCSTAGCRRHVLRARRIEMFDVPYDILNSFWSHSTSFSLYLRLWKFPQNLIGSSHFPGSHGRYLRGNTIMSITLIWQFLTLWLVYPWLMLCSLTPYIRLLFMYVIQYVWISAFIIVLNCLLDLWSLKHHSVNSDSDSKLPEILYLNLTSTLSSIKLHSVPD